MPIPCHKKYDRKFTKHRPLRYSYCTKDYRYPKLALISFLIIIDTEEDIGGQLLTVFQMLTPGGLHLKNQCGSKYKSKTWTYQFKIMYFFIPDNKGSVLATDLILENAFPRLLVSKNISTNYFFSRA
jgi:hypothetical protein